LKPQIGLAFLGFYLLRRRWFLSGVAVAFTAITAIAATARLVLSGSAWYESYRMTNRVLLTMGVLSDFTERNPMGFSLINLQVLFYALFKRAAVANIVALLLAAILLVAWIVLCWKYRKLDRSRCTCGG